ncbi:MAG: amino acid racemase [bacterium]|nr:amino acid racemase [bacterium]
MHRKIGILGGMSPESTVTYYEHITRRYTELAGDYSYPEIVIHSVSFQKYVEWQRDGRWGAAAADMVEGLEGLRRAGAEFGLIATNTMHIVFGEVERQVQMPLISIVTAAAEAVVARRLKTVGLLGTVFTMRETFYKDGLARSGVRTLVPGESDQAEVNRVIYDELCRGEIRDKSKQLMKDVVGGLREAGAEGIVLGCTEIPLLIGQEDCELPVFDTTILHAEAALAYSIGEKKG